MRQPLAKTQARVIRGFAVKVHCPRTFGSPSASMSGALSSCLALMENAAGEYPSTATDSEHGTPPEQKPASDVLMCNTCSPAVEGTRNCHFRKWRGGAEGGEQV
jgi:hypothetical protein